MKSKVAFSDTYFSSINKMPSNIQAKVNQLVLKFQTNPSSKGLNFEKLNAVKDGNLRSLRVDQAYRVILTVIEEQGTYLFLWVDHHDKAYDWASHHKCTVNENTGTVQLYSTEHQQEKVEKSPATEVEGRSFSALKDRQLLKLGVPDEQVVLVRTVASEVELDQLQVMLPAEAYEGLYLHMAGELYEDILRERDLKEEETFDTTNFSAALERVQSMARFVVPSDERELSEILNAPMEKWRVFLHPAQRKLVQGVKNGPVRVLGGAGTGKTVVAMHRANWLASNVASPVRKVLFTTFTKNLATDIKRNLESICSPDSMARKSVV